MTLTHTQKRLLLEAHKLGGVPTGRSWLAWNNLKRLGLVTIHGFYAELTNQGYDEARALERQALKQADFERRYAAKRIDA